MYKLFMFISSRYSYDPVTHNKIFFIIFIILLMENYFNQNRVNVNDK